MNEPTIEPAATQPADPDRHERAVDAGSVRSDSRLEDADTTQGLNIDLELHSAPNQDAAPPGEAGDIATSSRLDRATLWLPCLELFVRVIIPVLIASIFVPLGTVIFLVVCFGLLPMAALYVLHYITFRYLVTDKELVINSGVIFRRERRIPLDRVQELEIHQGVVHRILDLAKMEITTAGSDAQEASLNVLSRQAAEDVKATIGKCQGASERDYQVGVINDKPDYVCQLGIRDLLLGGLTSKLVASLGAVLAAIVYFQIIVERWWGKAERELGRQVERRWNGGAEFSKLLEHLESMLPDLGPFNFVFNLFFDDTLAKSLSLVLVGLAGSVVAYVVRYHGFRLARSGDLLTTSYGLLAIRRGSLARDRIQAIKLEEGLLRRYFGLATIRADSAGDRREIDETTKRDVLVPVASKTVAHQIAEQAMPELTTVEPNWKRVSPRAVLRGSKKGWLLIIAIMAQTFGMFGWFCLILLPAIPAVYFLNYQWFRHTGYWMGERHFLSRKGWINRETVCLPLDNIQNVSVTQSFFDRRLSLAALSIDTAGQSNTGGGPIIRHLPVEEAKRIQRSLANRVADHEFI